MANLVVYYDENKGLHKIKKVYLKIARQLANVFRFINNLKAINDGGEYE